MMAAMMRPLIGASIGANSTPVRRGAAPPVDRQGGLQKQRR